MTEIEIKELIIRNEKTALAMGLLIGQLSGLMNRFGDDTMSKQKIYKELHDIWKSAGIQLHAIYHKEKIWENIESYFTLRGKQ